MSILRYILPFILVILSGLMYVLYIQETYKEILSLRDQKVEFQNAINAAGEVRDIQAKLLAEVEGIDPVDKARLEKLLPPTHDPVLVLHDLNVFVKKHGLTLKNPSVIVSPQVTPNNEQPSVTPTTITFSVSAPYSVLRGFMADLEHELALQDVIMVKITPDSVEGGSVSESSILVAQITVRSYAYSSKEKIDPVSSSITQ
jgi:hypothetical protein